MNQSSGDKPVIHVKMFGGLTITMDEKAMYDSDSRSRKTWSLLSCLVIKRKGDANINELFRVIWQDGIRDNPYSALKTLVFRVRKVLEAAGFSPQDLVLSQKEAYMWNSAWETEADMDQFESLCRRILNPELDGENIWKACLGVFEFYRGIFLPRSAKESWVGPMVAYYHTLHQKLVVHTAEELIRDKKCAQVEEICQRAIDANRLTEDSHYYWIYAVYGQGERETALKRYKDTTDIFHRECLMTPLEHFKELYRVISNSGQKVVTDLDVVRENLGTGGVGEGHGAYQCGYAVFKRLVQLEHGGMEHSGGSVYLCLLAVRDREGCTLKPEIQARAMERLRTSTQKSLRSSDVYVCYSVSQLILLLSSATSENSEMIMDRILSTFDRSYICKDVAVNYSLDVLKP